MIYLKPWTQGTQLTMATLMTIEASLIAFMIHLWPHFWIFMMVVFLNICKSWNFWRFCCEILLVIFLCLFYWDLIVYSVLNAIRCLVSVNFLDLNNLCIMINRLIFVSILSDRLSLRGRWEPSMSIRVPSTRPQLRILACLAFWKWYWSKVYHFCVWFSTYLSPLFLFSFN